MTTGKSSTSNKSKPISGGKTKIVAGAIGIATVAGGAGYAYHEIVSPPGSIYTVSYYKLRKAKHDLDSLTVRMTDEAPLKYNSNGNVPANWADTNNSGCRTRPDVLLASLENATNDNCEILSGELFDYYTGKTISLKDGIDIDHIVAKKNAWDSGGYIWNGDTWGKIYQ